jgi:hypothetical protein
MRYTIVKNTFSLGVIQNVNSRLLLDEGPAAAVVGAQIRYLPPSARRDSDHALHLFQTAAVSGLAGTKAGALYARSFRPCKAVRDENWRQQQITDLMNYGFCDCHQIRSRLIE